MKPSWPSLPSFPSAEVPAGKETTASAVEVVESKIDFYAKVRERAGIAPSAEVPARAMAPFTPPRTPERAELIVTAATPTRSSPKIIEMSARATSSAEAPARGASSAEAPADATSDVIPSRVPTPRGSDRGSVVSKRRSKHGDDPDGSDDNDSDADKKKKKKKTNKKSKKDDDSSSHLHQRMMILLFNA